MLERLVHVRGQFIGLQLRVLADDGADQLADELGVGQLVTVDEADDLAGAGHAVLPHHVVEVGKPGIEVDADRKSTRLNSSHSQISYAVFCLKKKKKK